jgi:hypothetical protein
MMALLNDSQVNLQSFVQLYRACLIYAIVQHYPTHRQLQFLKKLPFKNKDEHKLAVKTLKELYSKNQGVVYNKYALSAWCPFLSTPHDLSEPLTIRYTDFPLSVRMFVALKSKVNGESIKRSSPTTLINMLKLYKGLHVLQQPISKQERLKNEPLIDIAYITLLFNAYVYYHCDPNELTSFKDYMLSDLHWDELSKALYALKPLMDQASYPVIFDDRFEAGQSLFWLAKDDYPSLIKGVLS